MANRPENTVCYEGFRISKFDFDDFKSHVERFAYAFMDRDGSHTRPFLFGRSIEDKYKYDGIILEIEADGIVIKGWTHDWKPNDETMTADWKTLLKNWINQTNESWVLN